MYIWTKGAEASLYKRLIVEEFFFPPTILIIYVFCFIMLTFLSELSMVQYKQGRRIFRMYR